MFFLSENFTFNGKTNKSMNVELVNFDEDFFYQRGLPYNETINKLDSFSENPLYTSIVNDSVDEIVLNLLLVENNRPKVWTTEKIKEIMGWLVTEDFEPFISEDNQDIVYYFKASNIVKYFTPENTGYLEVTFQPYSSYGYIKKEFTTSGSLIINNPSNINNPYKPIIKVTSDVGNISITNSTKKETFTLNDVTKEIVIDNLYRTVQTLDGENKISNCNRGWISLNKGNNNIEVVGGSATFICEFPVII